jgi:hypothetical protein
VLAAALALAGCGGSDGPRLAHEDAAPLIELTRRVAAEGACAQARDIRKLQAQALALVNRRRVPQPLQEPLAGGVADLADQAPKCVPASGAPLVPTQTAPAVPAAAPQPARPARNGHAKGPKHAKPPKHEQKNKRHGKHK